MLAKKRKKDRKKCHTAHFFKHLQKENFWVCVLNPSSGTEMTVSFGAQYYTQVVRKTLFLSLVTNIRREDTSFSIDTGQAGCAYPE